MNSQKANKICKNCNKSFYSKHPNHFCSEECSKEYKQKKKIEQSHQKCPDGAECKICGFKSNNLVGHINMEHKINKERYLEKFPNAQLTTEVYINKLKTLTGDKNPAYQHGGKYSPFSEKFIHKDKVDIKEIQQKVKDTKRKNNGFPGWKEYWIDRGYSEQEAIEQVSNYQRTFSKDICIEKYGEVEGMKVFEKRQSKWQNTLNSKSDEEKARINKAKASGQYISKKEKIVFNELKRIFPEIKRQLKIKENENIKYVYDFYYKNKIIEFNGDYWYCNPSKYDENHIRHHGNISAKEIWNKDKITYKMDMKF